MPEALVYLDNAATTFPKPREVLDGMVARYARMGVSPGRGGYDLAADSEALIHDTRVKLARLFGAPDPDRVVFTANATDSLNLAIQGICRPGDHVVTTRLEHNSVLRPLYHLEQEGRITTTLLPFDEKGFVDPEAVARAIRPETALVVLNHASNVLGTVQPADRIGAVCAAHKVPLLVDASQSAGQIPVKMAAMNAAAIAFTGHKSLYGPSGIGGLVLHPDLEILATRFGGTGWESASRIHTQRLPHRLEAGTHNLMGIIGLSLALDYLHRKGLPAIHQQEMRLTRRLRDGLAAIPGVTLYAAEDLTHHLAVLSADIRGMSPQDVGAILDGDFNIAVRVGLHCAPLLHADIGTEGRGTVRFSLGIFNTAAEIDHAITSMARIAEMHQS